MDRMKDILNNFNAAHFKFWKMKRTILLILAATLVNIAVGQDTGRIVKAVLMSSHLQNTGDENLIQQTINIEEKLILFRKAKEDAENEPRDRDDHG